MLLLLRFDYNNQSSVFITKFLLFLSDFLDTKYKIFITYYY